jgi:hypothetical protein
MQNSAILQKLMNLPTIAITVLMLAEGCSDEPTPKRCNTEEVKSIIAYFNEIALGYEYGDATPRIRKWKEPMRLFVGGNSNNALLKNELTKIIDEINGLATDNFNIQLTTDSTNANCYMYWGDWNNYIKIFPTLSDSDVHIGLFEVWWNNHHNLTQGRIFVDDQYCTSIQQRSILREELTQALGLGNDSPRYPTSIFYETDFNGGFVTEYSSYDRELIRLLYHASMPTGASAITTSLIIQRIFNQENRCVE